MRLVVLPAALGAATTAGVLLGRCLSKPNALLRLRLKLAHALASSVTLACVRVPLALLPKSSSSLLSSADAEGFVLCDVQIAGGKISRVDPPGSNANSSTLGCINLNGAVLSACFIDAHTHLVKTHAHPRARNPTGSISDALATEMEDNPRWAACPCCRPIAFANGGAAKADADDKKDTTIAGFAVCVPCPNADDVVRRMDFALATAYHHGTRAIRTHLDGTNSPDAKTRATVYAAFETCRAKYKAKGVTVQGVMNLYLPLWSIPELSRKHVEEACRYEGVLLGAYCGNVNGTPDSETAAAFDALFGYALEKDLQVDLHIDETNDKECCALVPLVHALKRARAKGYAREVVLGHCTSLSLQEDPIQRQVISGLRACGGVAVICNPSTNLGLQDRRGSAFPHCSPIDPNIPRTPLWRGLTLVQELTAGGVPVGAASDNVRDWWHAYGDYDGLSNYRGAITMAHLDTAPNEGWWAGLVTENPAFGMGIGTKDGAPAAALDVGAVADLILFPAARGASELLSRPQEDRIVLRGGAVQESTLPKYEDLDDLVSRPTDLSAMASSGGVQRGASKVEAGTVGM